MLAHGVLSNHTTNLTSSQTLGISLQESSSRMERSGGFNVLESRLVGERERENKGGEGVYILPPPKVTVVCFLVVPGSSGVLTERTKHTLKFPGPDHPIQDRIIRPGQLWTLTSHQVQIIRPRAGSSRLTPKVFALLGRIIRPSPET